MAYPNTFLDDLSIYNAKAAVVIKNLSLEGNTEEAILLSTLKSTANDISLSDGVRLDALTALINQGRLLDYALAPYFPSIITYKNSQTYIGLHNQLSGLNTGDFYHLTYPEYLKLVNLPDGLNVEFSDILGPVSGNTNLQNALNLKEDLITTGSASRFFAWDKTWKDIDYTYITNRPTTLAGLGISASDTLFDGKYLQPSTVISSYTIGANAAISNTDTLFGALGKIQSQINSIGSSNGTINYVGVLVPPGFFLSIGNSPLTGSGGDISITLESQLQNTIFAAPSAGNGIPSFRLLDATDLPLSGVVANTYGDASNYPIIQVDDYGRITSVSLQLASGTGTVQSVDVTMPSEFAFTGGPVTSNGSIDFTWNNQTAGKVLASPETLTGVPAFRELVASDIPDIAISQVTNLQDALNNNANLNTLPNAQIFIGNPSSRPQPRAISGVITIDNEGTTYPVNNSIPLTALEHINDFTLLGRLDAPFGEVQVVTLSPTDFVIDIYGNLSLASPVAPSITAPGQLLSYNAAGTPPGQAALPAPLEGQILVGYPTRPAPDEFGLIWVTPSGVIDNIGTDGTVTLADNSIAYEKLLDSASANILLGVGSTPGAIAALNSADATAILDSFGGGAKGLVPGGSSNDPTKFLSGAGTWLVPSGGGGGGTTTFALLMDNTGTGATSGTTFDGSVARTISYNTIGAPSVSGTNATGTWGISITGNAANVTGIVGLANGGTNANLTAVAGAVAWSSSSSIGFTAVGSLGQILRSAGTSSPTWTTATYPSTTVKDRILVSTSNDVIGEINAPTINNTFLKWDSGIFSWDFAGGVGTVTTTGSPASGNMAKFSGSTSITNAIAATDYVAPGAATTSGITMSTSRLLGRTTASTGAIEEISLTTTGTSGAATLSGGVLNIPQYSGGGGSGTVNSGTLGAIAYYAATGTAVSGTTNLYIDNTNGRINIGAFTAPNARLQISAGTASVPQLILTPTTAIPSGVTAGSMWYYESGGTEYLALYKTTAATQTKIITKDRNPDFVTSSNSGIIVSDANGTLTKSADLTALGILATYSTYTATTTATNIFSTVSFTGSTGLPANFFATGKTIVVNLTGQYTSSSGSPTLVLQLQFGTYSQTFTINLHSNVATANYWGAQIFITCSVSGASGSLRTMGNAVANDSTGGGGGSPTLTQLLIQTATGFNTTTASTIVLNANYATNALTATIDMCQIYYLN